LSFHLFQAYGVELEYMVVDRATLAVRPVVDQVLKRAAALPGASVEEEAEWPGEVVVGDVSWSNELTLHVLELKAAEPARGLEGLAERFAGHVRKINELLEPLGCILLPTGMHPTMDPFAEMKLWPHDYGEVYAVFNRIFDCRGHGWANLQAAHLNLPFSGDASPGDEFGRLHAAVRYLLPIMPALSASTPIMDGRVTGIFDNRLEVYRTNSRKIPAAAGMVIPEPVFTRADYDRVIFQEIYRQYAPHDPTGVLRHEWANSRGAIARFTRDTIEIRVLDVQECPAMDLAIAAAISGALRGIVEGRVGDLERMRGWQVGPLHEILLSVITDGDRAVIRDQGYRELLGYRGAACTAGDLWRHLIENTLFGTQGWTEFAPAIGVLLDEGCLARRIVKAVGSKASRARIDEVYRALGACLASNSPFVG
jgi:gamma-glutamyl:cysteine ligase YbdK (ATP-grasp superfamily)